MCRHLLFSAVNLAISLLFLAKSHAQVVPEWTVRYDNGLSYTDMAYAMKVDGGGNVYVTGESARTDGQGFDMVTVKYSPTGTQLWAASYGATNSQEYPTALALDPSGNAYVVGQIYDNGHVDLLIVKYSAAGVEQWAHRLSP